MIWISNAFPVVTKTDYLEEHQRKECLFALCILKYLNWGETQPGFSRGKGSVQATYFLQTDLIV